METEVKKLDMSEAATFIGTKIVRAVLCSKSQFARESVQIFTGEDIVGYKVQYEDGYTSWSPKSAFDKAYKKVSLMSFAHAMAAAELGKRVRRQVWEEDIYVILDENRVLLLYVDNEVYGLYKPIFSDMQSADWSIVGLVGIFKNKEHLPPVQLETTEKANRNFGWAVEALRAGKCVTGKKWDGFLKCSDDGTIEYWIADINYGWYDVSNDDIFATDWMIYGLEDKEHLKPIVPDDEVDPECVIGAKDV